MNCRFTLSPALLALLVSLPGTSNSAQFIPLGDLPGGAFDSYASDVSDDGSVVVGFSSTNDEGTEAFRWTAASGLVGLGDLPGGFYRSRAWGVSADGSMVIGTAGIEGSIEAFRWTQAAGLQGLGDLAGRGVESAAEDVSADGAVVVGHGLSDAGPEAYRWTPGGGMVGLGDLEGGVFWSAATAVSADGATVVGWGHSTGTDVIQAFRWTAAGGMAGLGDLPGGAFSSRATDVSGDGRVVVGWSESASGMEAFVWTAADGMLGLGAFSGAEFRSEATGVSADGQVVVGQSRTVNGLEAFVWTEVGGMVNLKALLLAQGQAELNQWGRLTDPNVSSDGRWIVGRGRNPQGDLEAFLAQVDGHSASGFNINPGMTDAWFNPATNGQGFLLTVFPVRQQLFLAWFTYDIERPDENANAQLGEPGHRWLTAQGPYSGDTAELTVYLTEGGVFDAAEPAAATDLTGYGTMTVEFADCREGLITYDIEPLGVSGVIPIERLTDDNVTLCEAMAGGESN